MFVYTCVCVPHEVKHQRALAKRTSKKCKMDNKLISK